MMRHCMAAVFAAILTAIPAAYAAGTYSATSGGEHAIELAGGTAEYSDITVTKTGDQSGDDADFYGTNAAILASGGSTLTITGASTSITTDGQHANAVFAYGATVNISDATITTSSNNSGGIMTTGGGTMNASNLTVATSGGSSAAIRSDRGGGTVKVDGGTYTTSGNGSPAIYSTADITVSNATLESRMSEGVVVEGKNSVALNNCTLTADNNKLNGKSTTYKAVMLYQSMSGDSSSGTSSFSMTGGTLTNAKGDIFYVTNNAAAITLSGAAITNDDNSGAFLRAKAAGWGSSGSNGGRVTLTADGQSMDGDMIVDSVSSLNMTLKDSSSFNGAIPDNGGSVTVAVEEGSSWNLTGDSYVSSLTNNGTINTGNYTLYVDGAAYDGGTDSGNDSSGDTDGNSGTDSGNDSGGDTGGNSGTDSGNDSGGDTGGNSGTDNNSVTGGSSSNSGCDAGVTGAGLLLLAGLNFIRARETR